ncbi:amidohydrolase family protein [Marispirochaeta aestuarii]|uniref:amidohydrolase family protein n=1 Tax=Marispirochaeta aestuarii TaxID=1963862 RepID=UPI0029C970CA|nr:amidohydrolase family protein [Marispirochaeta aestuarii]
MEQIAGVLRRVYDEDPKALHHQIIHCEMVSDRSLELLEGLPAAAPVQPAFDALWGGEGGLYEKHLGKEGRALCNRYASLARAGVLLTGGSDWYITPLDPLGGIRAATRLSNPAERLSPFEAIRLYTVNAAKLTASDDRQGYLREGYECDLSIVSGPGEGEKSAVKGLVKEGKLLFLRGRT